MAMATVCAAELPVREKFKRPDSIPAPLSNPLTLEKAALGKTLFFDVRLSRSGEMACATCHAPDKRWSDARALPLLADGVKNARRTPSVLNSAWLSALMWDGRASSLEAQAVLPITTAHEMNFDLASLVSRLNQIQGYRPLFLQAFADASINQERVTQALASFQRTLVSNQAPFDLWVNGDEQAIGEDAKRGFALFNDKDKANCVACHSSWRFTDDSFHDIGLSGNDPGRGAKVPAGITLMQYAFKTPSLRDLSIEGPYMHDGSMHNLKTVIRHYKSEAIQRPSLSKDMRQFELSALEENDLIAFIKSLDGGALNIQAPAMPQ
ncbi:tryptophan tryptophylquinone biosynthesis enzyme MauG [Methylophilus sp.]|uniref:tryptophan tryptophylquinone biosynthesis enzyme MauG n=1 Tax=Methylophilus sp. TaxID=29541 RepID=UPI0040375844